MERLEVPEFDKKLEVLNSLMAMRDKPNDELEQQYITRESIIRRIKNLEDLINKQRVLAIGDSDLTAMSIAIFGTPKEIVVVDIDRRLSDLLFEANMNYDLPVRFVYHDMRIRIIEILLNQFTLIIMEPPKSKAGIEVFLSRSRQCIQDGYESNVFISVPSVGEIRDFFDEYCQNYNITILEKYLKINEYVSGDENSDFLRLQFPENKEITVKNHWIEPFYQYEENLSMYEYRCLCGEMIKVGSDQDFLNIDELRQKGHSCGHKDVFAFHSNVKLI